MELTLDLSKRYTYADYLTWADDVRRELIEGFIRQFMFLFCKTTENMTLVVFTNLTKKRLFIYLTGI